MELLLIEVFIALGGFLLLLAIAADSRIFAFFSGIFFLISALTLMGGYDVRSGTAQSCTSFELNGTNQSACVSSTTTDVYSTTKNSYTQGVSITLLLFSFLLFYLLSEHGGSY